MLALFAIPTAVHAEKHEHVHFRLWQKPKFGSDEDKPGWHRSQLVLDGESKENWVEAIEIINAEREGVFQEPGTLSESLRSLRREHCRSVQDSVLASDRSSVFYTQVSDSCGELGPAERSFTRILAGRTMWVLIYTSRRPEIPEERRKQVMDAFTAAELVER